MKTVAILGPTASGKSALSIELAKKTGATILSLDSLSVYKEIDIASAKPSKKEREQAVHFGIDLVNIDEPFSAVTFIDEFKKAYRHSKQNDRPLLIVGGTSFYLKVLLEGVSNIPKANKATLHKISSNLKNLPSAYRLLLSIDPIYAKNISPADRYRIEKGLTIYYMTNEPPTLYFKNNPPKPIIKSLDIYEIKIEKDELNRKIEKRTASMIKAGLIDEVAYLEQKYGRRYNPMKAIGIKEVLDYFDGKIALKRLKENIITSTRQLAKRQRTFNKTQLPSHPSLKAEDIKKRVLSDFNQS